MSKIKQTRKTIPKNELKRRPPFKPVGRRILIVTEGQTEEAYFKAIQKRWKLHGMVIVKNPDCTDPESLLAYAKKENEINSVFRGHYDDVWLVYDLEKPCALDRRRLSEQVKNRVKKGQITETFTLPYLILHLNFGTFYIMSKQQNHLREQMKSFGIYKSIGRVMERATYPIKKSSAF